MTEVKLHPDWLAAIGGEFEQPYMAALKAFLAAERDKGKTIYPRPRDWFAALEHALRAIQRFGAQALVVSLGLDTFAGDPISGFLLQSADYLRIGERLAAAGLPTVLVFEGGYAVAEVGVNAANVLEGFLAVRGD